MSPKPLTDAEISAHMAQLPGWAHEGGALTKQYRFDVYLAGIAFASAVGVLAEGLGHHPDLLIGWRKVTITVSTHDAGNQVTQHDIALAQAVEALPYKPQG
jgi:4a-hydroxytetrahydrobiopterin dehydratase